jgi:Zn-dependent protease with chaperone function
MKVRVRMGGVAALGLVACLASPALGAKITKIEGLLEYRKQGFIVVDGQRVQPAPKMRFKGSGSVKSFDKVPAGWEIRAEGSRQPDGTILATKMDARPNGSAMFEGEVLQATNQAEQSYVKAGKIADQAADGKEQNIGELKTTGPDVDRARKIVDRLLPAYIDRKSVRVYVVENKEWNAMAMANYSIYVFSGIMKDLDDDELAVVLGHEIAHASYEHSRKQAKKGMYSQIGGTAASIGVSQMGDGIVKDAATMGVAVGSTTFNNVYSRDYEDQADRVGLRYVYEAGYDYTKAPKLWRRFAEKYGDQNAIENFFFGNHSLSMKRADALEKEIKNNYSNKKLDPPTMATAPATAPSTTKTPTTTKK